MKFVGIRRVEKAGQILKLKYIKSKLEFVEDAMKNYTQVYVKNSFEAAETYCKAFGAEITREFKNEDNTAYEHCELSVNGEGFLALAEAKNPCDISIVHKYKWETMTFMSDGTLWEVQTALCFR